MPIKRSQISLSLKILIICLLVIPVLKPLILENNNNLKYNISESIYMVLGEISGDPAYSIQCFTEKASYNPGENINIEIYITGEGKIEESFFGGHIPNTILSETVNVKVFSFGLNQSAPEKGWKPIYPQQVYEMGNRFFAQLTPGYFSYQEDRKILWSEGKISDPDTGTDYSPITVEFVIDSKAPGTDHKIEFIFKYKYQDEWYLSNKIITIHIRGFVERNARWISPLIVTIISILLVLLAYVLRHT